MFIDVCWKHSLNFASSHSLKLQHTHYLLYELMALAALTQKHVGFSVKRLDIDQNPGHRCSGKSYASWYYYFSIIFFLKFCFKQSCYLASIGHVQATKIRSYVLSASKIAFGYLKAGVFKMQFVMCWVLDHFSVSHSLIHDWHIPSNSLRKCMVIARAKCLNVVFNILAMLFVQIICFVKLLFRSLFLFVSNNRATWRPRACPSHKKSCHPCFLHPKLRPVVFKVGVGYRHQWPWKCNNYLWCVVLVDHFSVSHSLIHDWHISSNSLRKCMTMHGRRALMFGPKSWSTQFVQITCFLEITFIFTCSKFDSNKF